MVTGVALVQFGLGLDTRRFCIEKLASQISQGVKHTEPRQMTDWFSAEQYVDRRLGEDGTLLQDLVKSDALVTAYSELRRSQPELPKIETDLHSKPSGLELVRIARVLDQSGKSVIDLVRAVSTEQRRGYQEMFLGRMIWDEFYRPLINYNLSETPGDFLMARGYTSITFG